MPVTVHPAPANGTTTPVVSSGVPSALTSDASTTVAVVGDSTGNASDEWFHLFGQAIAAAAPDHRVVEKVWDDATQDYGAWSVIQAGTAERHALFVNTARSMRLPNDAITAPAGDWDVRVKVALDNWATGANQVLFAHYGGAGERGLMLSINPTGTRIQVDWSNDGTSLLAAAPPPNLTVPANGATLWVRATLDVDNGAGGYTVTAYTSNDGVTWTQTGQIVTAAGTTSVFNPNRDWEIGARLLNVSPAQGKIYEVQLRDGIDGPILNPQPIEAWTPSTFTTGTVIPTFAGSPTIYMVNGSHPGADIDYLSDATRLTKLLPPTYEQLVFLSAMHNENDSAGLVYRDALTAWLTALRVQAPDALFVPVTQNPQISPATYVDQHAKRRSELLAWAARQGLPAVDTYGAFLDAGVDLSTLIDTDGIHPLPAGSAVWEAAIEAAVL